MNSIKIVSTLGINLPRLLQCPWTIYFVKTIITHSNSTAQYLFSLFQNIPATRSVSTDISKQREKILCGSIAPCTVSSCRLSYFIGQCPHILHYLLYFRLSKGIRTWNFYNEEWYCKQEYTMRPIFGMS